LGLPGFPPGNDPICSINTPSTTHLLPALERLTFYLYPAFLTIKLAAMSRSTGLFRKSHWSRGQVAYIVVLLTFLFNAGPVKAQKGRQARQDASVTVYTLHNTSSYNAVAEKASSEEVAGAEEKIPIKVLSNPSRSSFRVFLKGKKEEQVTFSILDRHGRTIDRQQVTAHAELRFGYWYHPGTYFLDVEKDGKRQRIRLVKLAD
jgi:hypothetical protein